MVVYLHPVVGLTAIDPTSGLSSSEFSPVVF